MTFDPALNRETGASGRRYHLDMWTGWIRCRCDAHKKQVNVKQLYNPVPQTVRVSWSQLEFEMQIEAVRTSSQQKVWPSGPPVEQPSWIRKKCCQRQRNWGSICCSLFSLQLTSHTKLFRNPFATISNKVWEVYFSKEVCSFVIIVDYVSACICIRIVVSRLYNISKYNKPEQKEYKTQLCGKCDPLVIVQEIEILLYKQMVNPQTRNRPREWDVKSLLGFWNRFRSPNPGRKIKRNKNEPVKLCTSLSLRTTLKIKNEKRSKYLDLTRIQNWGIWGWRCC